MFCDHLPRFRSGGSASAAVHPHYSRRNGLRGPASHRAARYPSAERERERLHTGIEELDLELSIDDRSRLSNQLIQALLDDRSVALVVHVSSIARTRRLSID